MAQLRSRPAPNGSLPDQDPEQVNRRRLRHALEALERSLQLDPDNVGKNIRAWTGESFVYHALGSYEDELRSLLTCAGGR